METEGVVDILRLNIVGEPEGNAAQSLFIIANLLDADVFFGAVPLDVVHRHYKKRKKRGPPEQE